MHIVQPETVGLSSSRLARIRPAMQNLIDSGRYASLSTLVYRQGKVAWLANQGSDIPGGSTPWAQDALYRVFSMTKPITAVATMMLWEQGLFGLYDPISDYIPSFKAPRVLLEVEDGQPLTEPAAREVTIHDLLTHTSGLIYHFEDSPLAALYRQGGVNVSPFANQTTTEAFIDLLAAQPLAFHPGTSWHYGYSQDVLGRLIEVVSGQRFGEYLQEHVFEPLGMVDTDFGVPEAKASRITTLYAPGEDGALQAQDGLPQSVLTTKPMYEAGGAGLVSTMHDYLQLARLLLGQGQVDGVRLLGRKTVALMASNHLTPPQLAAYQADGRPGEGYGLGVGVTIDPAAGVTHCSVGDYGWGGAASTWFRVNPQEEMIVLIMTQVINAIDWIHAERFRTLAYAALI